MQYNLLFFEMNVMIIIIVESTSSMILTKVVNSDFFTVTIIIMHAFLMNQDEWNCYFLKSRL